MRRAILFLAALSAAACARAAKIVRLSVVGEPDGAGELTCVVDSDKGVSDVRASVTTADGAVVATFQSKAAFAINWLVPGTLKSTFPFKVEQPRLWSDETPILYRADVEPGRGGRDSSA